MAFATIATDSTWATRLAADIIRPATFVFLDWPSGEVRASTHYKSVTISGDVWSGVGNVARIDTSAVARGNALIKHKISLVSIPQTAVDDGVEASAIGRSAIMSFGLFDENWENPVLQQVFTGHILNAGDIQYTRDKKTGDWLVDASIEISNGRNPRRQLQNHHSPETAEGNDTGWRLLTTAGKSVAWPN